MGEANSEIEGWLNEHVVPATCRGMDEPGSRGVGCLRVKIGGLAADGVGGGGERGGRIGDSGNRESGNGGYEKWRRKEGGSGIVRNMAGGGGEEEVVVVLILGENTEWHALMTANFGMLHAAV